ncbi:MAG: ABC transporter ATP-binding protein [Actinobacteria bacterium]|nr:ABC transporter ATP-binding protein [Actinomycetota bacterium]
MAAATGAATGLEVRDLEVRYGGAVALAGIDLRVGPGEVVAVLGPSGSGKSTLLRAVAGLEPPTAGTVTWAGEDLRRVPPHLRRFGLMFQDHALFPHRDVAGNVAFGLRVQGLPSAEVRARTEAGLAAVGLAGFGARSVRELSGGEQQRVALARALAPEPRLLMLDEPLGALDRALREHLVDELRALFARRERAVLLVTHDHEEAFALADRVVVLHAGRVEQDDDASTVWSRPASAFVARFLGYNVTTAFGTRVAVRPDGLVWSAAPGPAGPDTVAVTVADRTFRRDHFRLRVATAAGETLDVAVRDAGSPAAPTPGTPGTLTLVPGAAVALT